MTESEIAAEFDRHHANLGHMWGYDTAKGRDQSAEAQIARCHAITGHGPSPQPAQSGVNPIPPQDTLNRICDRALWQSVAIVPDDRVAELERRIDRQCTTILELLAQRDAMTAERDAIRVDVCDMVVQRDAALLQMKAAIATSHGLIDAEVQRRIAEAAAVQLLGIPEHVAPAFPARALRHQSQAIGLLCTADAGRVRLGGYAPSLPPR